MENSRIVELVQQDKLGLEKYTKNGNNKEVYCVAKNIPFVIRLTNYETFDFSQWTIKAALYLDTSQKLVELVKGEAMECVSFIDDAGKNLTAECRIKVLSSQYQDLFVIRFQLYEPTSTETIEVNSHPIRVVSKTKQAKDRGPLKLGQERTKRKQPAEPSPKQDSPQIHDISYLEELGHIEETVKYQMNLLYAILGSYSGNRYFSNTQNSDAEGTSDKQSTINPSLTNFTRLEDLGLYPESETYPQPVINDGNSKGEVGENEAIDTPNSFHAPSLNNPSLSSDLSPFHPAPRNVYYSEQRDEIEMYFRMFIHCLQQASEQQKKIFLKKMPENEGAEGVAMLKNLVTFLAASSEGKRRKTE